MTSKMNMTIVDYNEELHHVFGIFKLPNPPTTKHTSIDPGNWVKYLVICALTC